LGYPDQARRRLEESLTLAHRLEHPFTLAFAHSAATLGYILLRDEQAFHQQVAALTAIAEKHAFLDRDLRRECLDWIIPSSEQYLRKTLCAWLAHYNRGRPHSSLGPAFPIKW
jgi:hypothetical protein